MILPGNKVLVQSDGTPAGTFVYDRTGRKVEGHITKIEWSIQPDQLAQVRITFGDCEIKSPAIVSDPLGR
jgi:hypothetical protein